MNFIRGCNELFVLNKVVEQHYEQVLVIFIKKRYEAKKNIK